MGIDIASMTTQEIVDWVAAMTDVWGNPRNSPDSNVGTLYDQYQAELARRKHDSNMQYLPRRKAEPKG